MLFKYLFKNIFAKPGRLIVIMICMIVACFAGFLALDLGSTLGEVFDNFGEKYVGGADYLIVYFGTEGITDALFEGTVPAQFVGKRAVKKREITRDEKLYNYAITDSVNLYSFSNPDAARQLKALRMETLPNDGEVAISKKYSEKYGYQIGDELVVYNSEEEAVPLTVVNIYDNEDYLGEMSGYINDHQCSELLGQYTYTAGILGVEDTDREEFEKFMEENHPNIVLTKAYLPESLQKLLTNITYVLYLVFVLVFVLVVFVTVSFVEKIVVERMSVIGTLRSIGMSMRKTTFILILENVIYGVAGSIIGFLLYLVLRGFILNKIGGAAGAAPDIGPVNPLKCLLVIAGAILIQVLVPLAEILKAVKTSIRDIIFDTRDGEYKVSVFKTVLGFVLMVGGFILGFTIKNLPVSIASVLLLVLGGALSIQFIVREITLLLAKIFRRTKMPVAELAAFETGSKKPNSSNAVLAIAAITASAAIFVLGNSVVTTVKRPVYDADVIVEAAYLKTGKYEYLKEIEDVREAEYIYVTSDAVSFNGEDFDVDVLSLPKTDKYNQYGKLPDEIGEDEMIIDIQKATVLGLKEGDTVDLAFHNTGIFPRKKTLKVAGVTEYNKFLSTGTIILSEKLYNELYPDEVALILVGTDHPEKVKTEIENSFTNGETVMTRAEYLSEVREDAAEVTMLIIGVMAAAIGLTLIGISGNQVIGFASRKKEYAMLHSCACGKKDIIKMILTENGLLFGISVLIAAILCVPVSMLVQHIFILSDTGIYVEPRYETMFISLIILWIVTMITALTPIRSLIKMNTAMEMKYE